MTDAATAPSPSPPASSPSGHAIPPDAIDTAFHDLECEFAAFLPRDTRVELACAVLREHRDLLSQSARRSLVDRLVRLLEHRTGSIATALFGVLEEVVPTLPEPGPLMAGLLAAQDSSLQIRALEQLAMAVTSGVARLDMVLADTIARHVAQPDSPLAGRGGLDLIRGMLERLEWSAGRPEATDAIEALYTGSASPALQRLAAGVLDIDGALPGDQQARRLLGEDAAALLAPYLAFSRATHQDLLNLRRLVDVPGALDSFRRAERVCGQSQLRDLFAALGSDRLNLGLQVHQYAGISIAGAFPLLVSPAEASLLESCRDCRRVFDKTVIVAVGGRPGAAGQPGGSPDATPDMVTRFRAYNVVHAELLADLLDMAPMTPARLRTMLGRLDRVVDDFGLLFGGTDHSAAQAEAAEVGRVYAELKHRITGALDACATDPLPVEICRLVQTFEDPDRPGEIHTLHGLKRYLHQRGLKLAFSLVESHRPCAHTVDVAVSTARGFDVVKRIEFVDFDEAPNQGPAPCLPYAVAWLVEAFTQQMLHGHRLFPHARILCYGTEVHFFVTFRNHPAFIRIDFSPPLRGGMVDLQYLGVSNAELSWHPRPSLQAIRQVFERLDFIVEIDRTRILARYDKERACALDDLAHRARAVLHLIPYLMDLDWTVGSLSLSETARIDVGSAWADFFARWGVLPYHQWLTGDRTGIVTGLDVDAEGAAEIRWPGRGRYRDRYSVELPAGFGVWMNGVCAQLGLDRAPAIRTADDFGQWTIERSLLAPLRAAVARGELVVAATGLSRRAPGLFERVHEAERLIGVLESSAPAIAMSVQIARIASLLQRDTCFQDVGAINGYPVRRACLISGGSTLALAVLCDRAGAPCLAYAASDPVCYQRRSRMEEEWEEERRLDVDAVLRFLRRANIFTAGLDFPAADDDEVAEAIRGVFRTPRVTQGGGSRAGERVIRGLAASPGRAAGTVRLRASGLRPKDLAGSVLVTPRLEPSDTPFLAYAEALVSTGGGILSHLGLMAQESAMPALIVDGRWPASPGASPAVVCRRTEFDQWTGSVRGYELQERHAVRVIEEPICDGDVVVVDGDNATLTVLGHSPSALALHDSLRLHREACGLLERARHDDAVLSRRGGVLQARHQIERALVRVVDPALARYAVEEILMGSARGSSATDGNALAPLRILLASAAVGDAARQAVRQVTAAHAGRFSEARQQALSRIPLATTAHDVLALRLAAVRPHDALGRMMRDLLQCGVQADVVGTGAVSDVDALALARLEVLHAGLLKRLATPNSERTRQRLVAATRKIEIVAGPPGRGRRDDEHTPRPGTAARRRGAAEQVACDMLVCRADAAPLSAGVGPKAANLAAVAEIAGTDVVPPWFAVTDRVFQQVLDLPLSPMAGVGPPAELAGFTLRQAIDRVIATSGRTPAWMSHAVRALWESASLPDGVRCEVARAYHDLCAAVRLHSHTGARSPDQELEAFVAIRSSGFEEDTEASAGAGQFDSFLFISGEHAVLDHIKRGWAGFWSERAIQDRARRGHAGSPHAGLLVQHMVNARVSGVVQTINVAEGRPHELVINAGLGLGEGIVSGAVSADHVVVAKDGRTGAALRFRYLIADKRERVVFDDRFGQGTVRVATLAHQRLRASLEYAELVILVDLALQLEDAYAEPLDIEFGFENHQVRILQVRPVPAAQGVWRDSLERFPLDGVIQGREVFV